MSDKMYIKGLEWELKRLCFDRKALRWIVLIQFVVITLIIWL